MTFLDFINTQRVVPCTPEGDFIRATQEHRWSRMIYANPRLTWPQVAGWLREVQAPPEIIAGARLVYLDYEAERRWERGERHTWNSHQKARSIRISPRGKVAG